MQLGGFFDSLLEVLFWTWARTIKESVKKGATNVENVTPLLVGKAAEYYTRKRVNDVSKISTVKGVYDLSRK